MADPVSMSVVIASGLVAAGSQVMAGQQAKAGAKYQAAVAQESARAMEFQAAEQAKRKREQGQALLARQRVLYGASGVNLMFGSPLLVMEETAGQIELEAQDILFSGKTGAVGLRSQGAAALAEGKSKATASYMNAFGSLLKTGASVYDMGRKK